MEKVTLNNGVEMPTVGYGVFLMNDKEQCKENVYNAIKAGYRMIDTAQAYFNEDAVGDAVERAISEGIIKREDIFLVTKIWYSNHSKGAAYDSVIESMKKLKVDYIDLCLIHQAIGDYYAAYQDMEQLYNEKKLRAIGISNFSPERMVDLCIFSSVKPAVNQVESHVFFQQSEMHEWMIKYNVQHMAWGPLAQPRIKDLLSNSDLIRIGKKYNKSPAQVALRSLVQRNIIVIPKSSNPSRLSENKDIFDFALTDEDMEDIKKLDTGATIYPNLGYQDPKRVEYLTQYK